MGSSLRYFGGAVAFGFAAVWITASLAAALVCLLSAAVGYGVVVGAERTRAKLTARPETAAVSTGSTAARPSSTAAEGDLSFRADELNRDLGHLYEPNATTSHPAAEGDDTTPSETAE